MQYCIVLYLYIYIALLAVHTNQKRFQCERSREKRAVLRERKEAFDSPVKSRLSHAVVAWVILLVALVVVIVMMEVVVVVVAVLVVVLAVLVF